jgi:predicted PurR-regulated permease PerM
MGATAQERRGLRVLITIAALVVTVWGLKWAAPVILPLLAAAFLAVLCIPPMRRLERHRVPRLLAMIVVITGASLVLLLVVALVGSSLAQFQSEIGTYQSQLNEMVAAATARLGLDIDTDQLLPELDASAILRLAGNAAAELVSVAGNVFVVILLLIFMLVETNGLTEKLRAARRAAGKSDAPESLADIGIAARKVHDYLAIKAAVSGATGIAAALMCWALGVDFPLLWGLVAFLFNFIPNIGSIIAAIPPVLLALVGVGPGTAALLAGGYALINLVLGNIVEPKLMGDRLGLSTLVVFVSLIFWNWVWGPVGMLLSVPLTVIVKILLEHTSDLRPIGVLLGPSPKPIVGPE